MLPVAIVGGGPVGLVSSIMLTLRGIPNVVLEQYPDTSIHPKCVGLNQRTVEIFRDIGIEKEVLQHRAPLDNVSHVAWYTNLGPDRTEIYTREAWGAGGCTEDYVKASPCQYSVLAQIRLEPILKRRALELDPNSIRYNSKVVKVEEMSDHILIHFQTQNGEVSQLQARYMLGADGGRGLAESLGIPWQGRQDLVQMQTVHFKAHIAPHHPEKRALIIWLVNPKKRGSLGSGMLYHIGPYYPSRDPLTEEWVWTAPRAIDDGSPTDAESMKMRIQETLELPGLELQVLSTSYWTVNAKVTERYRSASGRIFLVGDACHRVAIWGALGLNTGIQDVQNLIWKLELALCSDKMHQYDGLLNTYELERKPIAERVARNSLSNMENHSKIMDSALGIAAQATLEQNLQALEIFRNPAHPDHKAIRERVSQAGHSLDFEFHAPGIEIGWFYASADIDDEGAVDNHGGQILKDGRFNITQYHPSTIPGHQLPHAWLRKGDRVVSTRDLCRRDQFVLLTITTKHWKRFESPLIHVEVIDDKEEWIDQEGKWREQCGVKLTGAVLVRPDRIVAWRADQWDVSHVGRLPERIEDILRGRTKSNSV